MKKNVYVDIILCNSAGAFLCQHHTNRPIKPWRFPGGKPEPGETLIAAAAREAKEELGIEALSLRYIGKQSAITDGGEVWTGYAFACDRYIGKPRVMETSKHDGLDYIPQERLEAMNIMPEAAFGRRLAMGQDYITSVEEL